MSATLDKVYVECPSGTYLRDPRALPGQPHAASIVWDQRRIHETGAHCYACKAVHPMRRVTVPKVTFPWQKARLSECDARCLNGRKKCNCKCRGRCHGAGVCSCPSIPPLANTCAPAEPR